MVSSELASTDGEANGEEWLWKLLAAGAGGAIAAWGWLAPHQPLLVVAGFALIFYLLSTVRGRNVALGVAYSGVLFYAMGVMRPLVSAYGWGGWSDAAGMAAFSASWWLLNGLWLLLSAWSSLFLMAALFIYWRLRPAGAWLRILALMAAWVLIAEWLRSLPLWRFEWGHVGLALVDLPAIIQWVSVFGLLFLSALLIGAAAWLVEVLRTHGRQRLMLLASGALLGGGLWLGGLWLQPALGDASHEVAAFQFSPPVPPAKSSPLGVNGQWFPALEQAASQGYELIVLPESISSRAVKLDGSHGKSLSAVREVDRARWQQALAPVFSRHPELILAIGGEAVEKGEVYNSTLIWGQDGLLGWQHKVHLVPFAEYLPAGWGFLRTQALTYYHPGRDFRVVSAGPFRIGGFICQEVQHGDAARRLTAGGANILVTGGNDGVFSDVRVALAHHSLARIRAVETGRYLVRAMKTGVSSVIAPDGRVLSQAPLNKAALVAATVALPETRTFWVRFGNWPLLLGSLALLLLLFWRYGSSRP